MKKSILLLPALLLTFPFVMKAQSPSKWLRSAADTTKIYNINSGSVGIGDSAPGSKLSILTSSGIDALNLKNSGGDAYLYAYSTASSSSSLGAYSIGGSPKHLVLQPAGGNVGIGVSSPVAPLNIKSNNTATSDLLFSYDASGNYRNAIGNNFDGATAAGNAMSFLVSDSTATGQKRVMTMLGNGKVGIGTTSPDEMLTVNGTTHAREVIVDLNIYPDYVFKPTYRLRTLAEVKTYIDQNHHLPDMPTEAEVIKNGLKVGESESRLTTKVEELTLYLLEKDKQLDQQKKIDSSLQTQLNLLNQRLNTLINKKTSSKKR